jgi:hypothetical protein
MSNIDSFKKKEEKVREVDSKIGHFSFCAPPTRYIGHFFVFPGIYLRKDRGEISPGEKKFASALYYFYIRLFGMIKRLVQTA